MTAGRSAADQSAEPQLRVLMLTYFFPPMGGAGVQRLLKFARYLPEYAVLPSVIAAASGAYPLDQQLMAEIPAGVDVRRIRHTPLLSRLLAHRRRLQRATAERPTERSRVGERPTPGTMRWRDRALTASAALEYPDDKGEWGRKAVAVAIRAAAENQVDVVFSSAPPISAHWAAMQVAERLDLPWVADFRDLWTANPAYRAPSWRRHIDRRLERRLIGSADGVVAVTPSFVRALSRDVRPGVEVIEIPNGYDEADYTGLQPAVRESGIFRLVHTGTFYGQRSPEPLLIGFQRLLERDEQLRDRLRLRLVGTVGSRFDPVLAWFSQRFPGVLERTGYVDHARALRELLGADALLLVVDPDDAVSVPGKVFEYLRAGRPILMVGPTASESAEIIRTLGAGEVVDAGAPDEIANVLEQWMLRGATVTPDPNRALMFDRRALTRRLAKFLRDVDDRAQGRSVSPGPGG